jgi:hypothetical protein
MQKLKITVPGHGEHEIDPDDFEFCWSTTVPSQGQIVKVKNPEKNPEFVQMFKSNINQFVAFHISEGE